MLCDFYELTMGNGYFQSGLQDRICYFDVFFRKCPDDGGFAIAAGLEQIIDYVEILNRLDTEGVEPMSHTFPVKNVLREDEVVDFGHHAELMGNAPAHDESAFLVPKTVE